MLLADPLHDAGDDFVGADLVALLQALAQEGLQRLLPENWGRQLQRADALQSETPDAAMAEQFFRTVSSATQSTCLTGEEYP